MILLLPPTAAFALASLKATPSEVSFAARCIRTAAGQKSFTLTNDGNKDATNVTVVVSPSPFADVFPLSGPTSIPTLAPGDDATISSGFIPGKSGSNDATARVTYETKKDPSDEEPSPSPQTKTLGVSLSGDGIDRFVDASPLAVNFGETRVGVSAGTRTVMVFDDGDDPLTITDIDIVGANARDFTVRPRKGGTITESKPLRLTVEFTARGSGARTAQLRIRSNGCGDSTVEVELAGIGVTRDIIVVPGRLDFGDLEAGDKSGRDVTIANQGGAPLRVTGIRVRGTDADSFEIRRRPVLPATLGSGGSLEFRVRFRAFEPSEDHARDSRRFERSARLIVDSNDPDSSSFRVPMSGVVALDPPTPTPTPQASPTEEATATASPSPVVTGPGLGAYSTEMQIVGLVAGFFAILVMVRRIKGPPD